MNQPPAPPPTALQSVSEPDSKSSMTNVPSAARAATFGPSSHPAKNRLSAATRISAPARMSPVRTSLNFVGMQACSLHIGAHEPGALRTALAASVRALMHEGAAAGLPHADAVAQRPSEFH